jgi:translation initiation factor eIF-2B subunit beta
MSKARSGSDLNVVEELESIGGLSAAVRSQFAAVRTGLKRRQLSGAHPCAKATVEVLRNVLGTGGYKNAKEMLHAVRLVGKELSAAAPAELTVGNITRRVMYMIREEYNGKKRAATEAVPEVPSSSSKQKPSGVDVPPSSSVFSSIAASITSLEESQQQQQQQQQSPSTPLGGGVPLRRTLSSYSSFSSLPSFGGSELMRMPSVGTFEREKDSQQPSLTRSLAMESDTADDFTTVFADLRQAVMSAVNELNDEIDNVYSPICEQAQDHIHHDECVLTNGWSYMVRPSLSLLSLLSSPSSPLSLLSPLTLAIHPTPPQV